MSKSVKEIAKIASEWWADKVINPKFDNGDSSFAGFMWMTMASMLVEKVDTAARDKFISFLSKSIEDHLNQKRPYGIPNLILDVDYGACEKLRAAGDYAGISSNNFPIKTVMWIDKDHISLRYGFMGKEEYLYANKVYWKYKIDSCKESIEKYLDGRMLFWIKDEDERNQKASESISEMENLIEKYKINLENAGE